MLSLISKILFASILFSGILFSTIGCSNIQGTSSNVLISPDGQKPINDTKLSKEEEDKLINAKGKKVREINIDQFERLLNSKSDTLYIFNFWATWCNPCKKEMKYFEELRDDIYFKNDWKNKKIQIVFVSIDNPELINTKVTAFIRTRGITSDVYLLNAKDPKKWMNLVSTDWTGSIPATLFVNGSEQISSFYEQYFSTKEELEAVVIPLMMKDNITKSH